MADLGFIGLGVMGKPMAGHLLSAGHRLHAFNRSPAPLSELAGRGAISCSSPREVAAKSDIVFLMLPDTPDVEKVLFGSDGVAEGLRAGSIVVDMSTISPIATREAAKKLRGLGAEMLDAPVSGGQSGAQNATLSFMVGGDRDVFLRIKPYFELMGKNIVHIGQNGDGQICKLANQIVVALNIEAVAEALVFASKAGADVEKVRQALLGGFAQSRILEVHGERMLKRNFTPGFRVRLHQKDLDLATQAARAMGIPLPGTALVSQILDMVAGSGGEDLDHSSLVTAIERMADHTINRS
ncbi:MAG: 2-hydroxy-3-oxopropionate reductase [Chloroflexi bacterium]|nr:2-hydroxy-3-oxopropionate reductase [Chloroflexota bacterium]